MSKFNQGTYHQYFILEALEFLLKNNNFNFAEWMFNQLSGTAMGASFAAFYACLVVGYLEETKLYPKIREILNEIEANIIIETYKRFMDDGIVFLPICIAKTTFLDLLNEMDSSLQFTLEDSRIVNINNEEVQKIDFLDISIMLYKDGTIETDIYYKVTNTHDYVHYDSFHAKHVLDNVPYNLAKKIIVFVSKDDVMEKRLCQMKDFLLNCDYPDRIIDEGIHNARLQGPAPKKKENENLMTFIHTNMSNFDFKHIIDTTKRLLSNAKSETITNVFNDMRIVEGIKQPKNILRSITQTRYRNTENPTRKAGLYAECRTRCELCSLGYIKECSSFKTTNGKLWNIKSHINCNSKNVIYFLTCTKCKNDPKTTKTGKTNTKLRQRMNNHRSDCRTGRTSDLFDLHVNSCMIANNDFDEPLFEIRAYMKLSSHEKLEIYESEFHKRKYATINT